MFVSRALRLGRSYAVPRSYGPARRWLHQSSRYSCDCSTPPAPTHEALDTLKTPPAPTTDHRDIGSSHDLFSVTKYSPGSPLFHPDGSHIFLKLQAFLRAQYAAFGFKEVVSPTIYKKALWETSGHWENYKDDMFEVTGRGASGERGGQIGEDEEYGLKPMNCPGHCLIYKTQKRSYRDLPIRYADFSPLHRNEVSGSLSGLTRVRRFHQDDGHIFCRPDQVGGEIERQLQMVSSVYQVFGFTKFKLVLSTRPKEGFIGTAEEWERAEDQLKSALDHSKLQWTINEGDGAFYGPKIDIILTDSDGKHHQTATIQLDFQLPQRFDLSYVTPTQDSRRQVKLKQGADQTEEVAVARPVIIHRAVLGSLERFMALLLEHSQGKLPFWLSPKQAKIITIGGGEDSQTTEYAIKLAASLNGFNHEHDLRPRSLNADKFEVTLDTSSETLGRKIRQAKSDGYSIVCVIGKAEADKSTVSVDLGNLVQKPNVDEWIRGMRKKNNKSHESSMKAVQMTKDDLLSLMRWMQDEYQ